MVGLSLVNHDDYKIFGLGQMDIGIDASGNLRMVSGRERVRHDLLKGILTGKTGSFGTVVPSLVGEKYGDVVSALATVSIEDFIQAYRRSQAADLPIDERISSISQTRVERDSTQPTTIFVQVVVRMADGALVAVEHTFTP